MVLHINCIIFEMHFMFLYRNSVTGTDLAVCTSDEPQCCTADYLEAVQMKLRRRLEEFIGEEFEEVIEEYQDEVDDLLECKL